MQTVTMIIEPHFPFTDSISVDRKVLGIGGGQGRVVSREPAIFSSHTEKLWLVHETWQGEWETNIAKDLQHSVFFHPKYHLQYEPDNLLYSYLLEYEATLRGPMPPLPPPPPSILSYSYAFAWTRTKPLLFITAIIIYTIVRAE